VKINGCGFFDFLHGQTGVAPNGIEIHPVLDIQFLSFTEEEAASRGYFTTPIDDPTYVDPEDEDEDGDGKRSRVAGDRYDLGRSSHQCLRLCCVHDWAVG